MRPVDSYVALVSHSIQNCILPGVSVSGKCVNVEYSIWRAKILSDEGLKFCEKLFANGTRRRRLTMRQYVLQYVKVALGRKWPSFFFLSGGTKITHAQCIDIIYDFRLHTVDIRRLNRCCISVG